MGSSAPAISNALPEETNETSFGAGAVASPSN